jgi:capsid protein
MVKKTFRSRVADFFASEKSEKPEIQAIAQDNPIGYYGTAHIKSFDGEKNYGEIGPIIDYRLSHKRLAARSWQAYLENDIAKTIFNRFNIWIIDKGLKIQCSPLKSVLKSEGIDLEKINFDTENFNNIAESRFSLWSKSKHSSYSGMKSLNGLAKEASKNSKIGGDVLVIQRFEDNKHTIELIDTAHLADSLMDAKIADGNFFKNGVEFDEKKKHIAYHVKVKGNKTMRVKAFNDLGLKTAFLVYGSEYRLDNMRGLPTISTSLETLKKVDRYKEASVGSAEERQKIPFFIEHDIDSTGESPLVSQVATMLDSNNGSDAIPTDSAGVALADHVAATTNKQTFNMTQGSTLKSLESKNELFFKEFYETNANIICAAVGIPPNVAFSIYNDSFSASRAATKDWEHSIQYERDAFKTQFYDPIFAFWLHIEILNNKISAPGYLVGFQKGNWMVTESYLNARFTGPMFPHIDPVKEVKAERAKLGSEADSIPLTTIEAATEALAGGDSMSNMEQFSEELRKAEDLDIIKEEEPIGVNKKIENN